MPLYKNKWEIKSWADLSASVADASNDLVFKPKHRLPYKLQQGAKASKVDSGFFNRESILTATDYPDGFFIYDTGSGLSYTGIPKNAFRSDLTDFLMSSSLSSEAKTTISSSFNAATFPEIVVQIDETDQTPATSSWALPCAIIGDVTKSLGIRNTSTNATSITILSHGTSVSNRAYQVEFTLPMEHMFFSPVFVGETITFAEFSGSQYSNETYESSSIATLGSGTVTTASIIGKAWGSGSLVQWNSLYDQVDHALQLKALGDGDDAIYSYTNKEDLMHFPSGSVVASESVKRYATTDTSKSTVLDEPTIYFVSGSTSNTGLSIWTGDGIKSGSHIFADENLILPADEGIYVFSGSLAGYKATIPSLIGKRVPQFQSTSY